MPGIRQKVRKSDMNILCSDKIIFHYAGLFSSAGPWIHPERTESTWEIIYVTKGEVFLQEEEQPWHLKEGQAVLLTPGIRHWGSKTTENVQFYWVHFRVVTGELPFNLRFFPKLEEVALFKELLHFNNLPVVPDYLVNAVLVHILAELCRLSSHAEVVSGAVSPKIYEWLRINACASLTVAQAAKHFGFSADHLTRLMKKDYGTGAKELINRFLMNRAKELLCNTDMYVKEIAAELGFSCDKAFIGYFCYHENCSPTAFRERFCKLHMNSR